MRERGCCLRWWWWRVTAEDDGSSSSPACFLFTPLCFLSLLLFVYLSFPPFFCSSFIICWWRWQLLGLRTVAGKPGGSPEEERITLPLPWRRVRWVMGAAGRAWFPSHFSSIMLAGYGCMGMGHAGFLASGVERESGENDLKSSTCAVKKKLHSAVQNGTVQVFFFFFFF